MLATMGVGSSSAQQVALQSDRQALQENARPRNPVRSPQVATAVAATDPVAATSPKPVRKPGTASKALLRGLSARTAASYGHAFVWFGKTTKEKSRLPVCTQLAMFCRTYWDI